MSARPTVEELKLRARRAAMSTISLEDALRSLFAAKDKVSEDEIAEVLAWFRLPSRAEMHKQAYIDTQILCECEPRMPRADMLRRIASKRNGGKSSGELERVVKGKRTAITQIAQPEYESMKPEEIAARHAWLMEDGQWCQQLLLQVPESGTNARKIF